MRLLKLGIYHPTYLRDFYNEHFSLGAQDYSVQHKILIDDFYGSSNFWTTAFDKLNYVTTDIIANADFLQTAWARENDVAYDDKNWIFEIAAAQIKQFRPDILLVADYSTFTSAFLRSIRRECPSIRMILGWCGAPYADASVFNEWDVVLSCIPELVTEFKNQGHQSFHINHAFAPRILEKLDRDLPVKTDFAFTGSVLKHNKFHLEREQILLELIKYTNLQVCSDIAQPSEKERRGVLLKQKAYAALQTARRAGVPQSVLEKMPLLGKAAGWKEPPVLSQYVDQRIARRAKSPVFGLKMFQRLAQSRVVLNTHIDVSPSSASNMRLFEATGVGTCLLTDWKENLAELFEPDAEVLTYRTAEECAEKVKYILEHESQRREIAVAGQRRTLSAHTFDNRVIQIDEIIKEFIKNKSSVKAI